MTCQMRRIIKWIAQCTTLAVFFKTVGVADPAARLRRILLMLRYNVGLL